MSRLSLLGRSAMLKFKLIVLFFVAIVMNPEIQAAQITSMVITGGSYTFDSFGISTPMPFEQIANVDLTTGYYPANWDLNTPQMTCAPGALFCHDFNGGAEYFNYYTQAPGVDAFGVSLGGDVPNGTVDSGASTIAVDFNSLVGNWNTMNFKQGPWVSGSGFTLFANGTVTPAGNANEYNFNISWESFLVGGPFNIAGLEYSLQGVVTIAPIPLPSALWLMISGLLSLSVYMYGKRVK